MRFGARFCCRGLLLAFVEQDRAEPKESPKEEFVFLPWHWLPPWTLSLFSNFTKHAITAVCKQCYVQCPSWRRRWWWCELDKIPRCR